MASSFVVDATKASQHRPLPQKVIIRQDANYHPSVWGEYFIQFSETITEPSPAVSERMEKLKKEVRALLEDEKVDVGLLDWIQRVGISLYFEKEIAKALEHVYQASINSNTCYKYEFSDLNHVAKRFRLLRQQGYHVSTGMFERFMDTRGKFKENIKNDIEGLLSLYEASCMSVKGEVILDEALEFAKEKLKSALPNLRGSLALQVEYALDIPLYRCTETLRMRRSISCYESEIGRNEAVVELAKLEFNLQQALHRKELAELTRWYNNLDVSRKLSASRNRIVESYFWILGALPEPQHSRARIINVKVFVAASLIDDMYDTYGTLKELETLNLAIERWDMQVLEQSGECGKEVFSILLKVFKEVEDLLNPDELYRIGYLREEMIAFVKSHFMEAKWYFTQYFPTFEEYVNNALESAGYEMLAVAAFTGLDSIATEDVFEWAAKFPSIIHSSAFIARVRNDIVGHKGEQEIGKVPTAVECYMKENGCTLEEAYKALQDMVDDAWKQINSELLHNSTVPRAILLIVLGMTRFISFIYNKQDRYTDSRFDTKDTINLLLVQPFTI